MDTVDERLQNAPWHTVDGKHYGVPYQWGPNVLMYNTEVFPEAPTSWDVTFEEMTFPMASPTRVVSRLTMARSTWRMRLCI